MASYSSFNLVESIIDEIALEGLDGITLQALWIRLANRLHISLPLSKAFMEQVWSICQKVRELSFYKLKKPRQTFVMFDRYEFVHPDLGIIFEPPNVPLDIYPHHPVQDSKAGVRGSCSTYYTRQDVNGIVKNINLDKVTEEYGETGLVIVASQAVRTQALMGVGVNPILEMTIMHYCFLERVGRSRYHGEVTQGKLSLAALKEEPKALFYYRKFLLRHKLITKQVHHQKSAGHCTAGSLLHLTRFYVERKPKVTYLAEQVLKILRSKENGVAEYDEIKKKLGIENSMRKLFKTSFFQKIVKTDICVPYRTLYPNAESSEWRQKQDPAKEKKIRVVQMLYPNVDIAHIWKKEDKEDDEDEEEINISNHILYTPYLQQANKIIEASQLEGVSQVSLAKKMGLTKLQSRTMLRNMVKIGIIAVYMNNIGRQRITRYVSKKFEKSSKMSKQFNKEIHKIKELTKTITKENEENMKNKANLQLENKISVELRNDKTSQISQSDNQVNFDTSADNVDKDKSEQKDKDTDVQRVKKAAEQKNLFHTVNRILRSYKLLKYCSKYKCTTSLSLLKQSSKADTKEQIAKRNISPRQQIANDAKATSYYESIKTNLVAQKTNYTGKAVNEVFSFMEVVKQNDENKNMFNITYRSLKRANMIIEAVKEHQVIDDMTKLLKMIYEEEDKEGYDVKIDKRSVIRILQKLAKDNLVKNIKLTLSANGREKNLTFICDPKIDIDHTVIQSAVEQAKVKFCLTGFHKTKESVKKSTDKPDKTGKLNSKNSLQEDSKTTCNITSANYKYDPKAGRRYGLSPKFIRMQTVHVLLFYLVYDHPGIPTISQHEQIEILRANGYDIDNNLAKEFSTIYNTKVDWQMFIPPFPKHNEWSKGWALMCDVLLGLPLSIFVKIHNICFNIPELEHYLNHPIRKNYLVKDLPVSIRNALLHARKYIFNIHDTITRLAYIGLVQFGPQRLKDKDQVFIYVNRHTELMDTVSSAPGYHKIEDKEYPVTKYFFDRTQIVEKYWYDMWNICVNTPLGGRLVVHGKDIILENLNKKSAMMQATTARTHKETIELDTGTVPGDHKGAAGVDSAFFAHLKRNWSWSNNFSGHAQVTKNQQKSNKDNQRDLHLSKIQIKPVKYTEYVGLKKVSGPPEPVVNGVELQKKVYDYLNKSSDNSTVRKHEILSSHQSTKQKSFVRRVMPRKKKTRRLKYDEVDYRAMQKMHKLRVDWEPHEVNILLVCKVATTYLSPNPRKQMVSFMAVRDVLRSFSYSSYNKTSRACQGRLMYMLRQPRTVNSVALGVEEIKQDTTIAKRYSGIMERLKAECKNSAEYEKRVTEVFTELVGYIVKNYYDIAEIKPKKHMSMPQTVQEFNLLFNVIHPTKPHHNQSFTKDVRNTDDINLATISSVIHSSMCCGKDKRSWAYQLFKVYQQYPEVLLRQAMNKIRTDQMVTIKKNHLSAHKKYDNCMPMSSSQYQLSIHYIYKFQTKWPYSMFKESYDVFMKLLQWHSERKTVCPEQGETFNGTEILPVSSGIVTTIHDLLARDQIDFDIEMPEQIIMLDSRLQEKDETYFRVAQRYQEILTRLYRFKFENVDAQNAESSEAKAEMDETAEQTKYANLKKRKLVDNKDEESITKRSCNIDEYNAKKQEKEFAENIQFVVLTQEQLMNKNIELEESTLKDRSSIQDQNKKKGQRKSRKRFIDAEDSEEYEMSKKRKLDFKDSMELLDTEEVEKSICDDSDNTEEQETRIISNPFESIKEQKQQEEAKKDEQLSNSTDLSSIPRRVNDIIRNMSPEMSNFSPHSKIQETSDIQKKYTRIAMLRLRKELSDLTVADSHHAHEYFVVNSFKIFYGLEAPLSNLENFKGYSVPSNLLPLRIEKANELLGEINRFAIFPKNDISYADYKDEIKMKKKEISIEWKYVDAVYKFVRDKKEIGACTQELLDKFFNEQGMDLYKAVSLLTENHIFLRSGVTSSHYIHHRYVNPWLIHSYKIYRLEQESVVPFKDSVYATMQQGKTDETKIEMDVKHNENVIGGKNGSVNAMPSTSLDNSVINEESTNMNKNLNNDENKREEDNDNDKNSDIYTRKRMQRQRTCLLPQKDVYKSAQQLDFTTAEEIKVVIKPWIRIDGVLNRKVLDRMLGAVLSYCLLHPGLTMAKVQSRFVPALQAFHTRELLEMLIRLGCLESKLLKKSRVTLFSQPSSIRLNDLSIDSVNWSAEDEIVLEPAIDAILKFSIFLSTRTYSSDFLP